MPSSLNCRAAIFEDERRECFSNSGELPSRQLTRALRRCHAFARSRRSTGCSLLSGEVPPALLIKHLLLDAWRKVTFAPG